MTHAEFYVGGSCKIVSRTAPFRKPSGDFRVSSRLNFEECDTVFSGLSEVGNVIRLESLRKKFDNMLQL